MSTDIAVKIGTAAWAVPKAVAGAFPDAGSGLEKYAGVFNAVEINSTFYRSHRATTFERWAASVPERFRFSVKVPKTITHEGSLHDCDALIDAFRAGIAPLTSKLGPLLLQLPPSLAFDPPLVEAACARLAGHEGLVVACEPRHPTWFTTDVDRWLAQRRIARVAAHPSRHPGAATPGGWRGLAYYRLHGAPRIYYSAYDAQALGCLAARLDREVAPEVWCIFDNTALGSAAADALALRALVGG